MTDPAYFDGLSRAQEAWITVVLILFAVVFVYVWFKQVFGRK